MLWVIADEFLRAALQRVAEGADPEMTYMELYANSTGQEVSDDG